MSLQRYWDTRAAANFALGGTGSGLLIFCLFIPGNEKLVITGLVLVATGLGAVWLEIGRKLRAIHVFFNPFTSWMTRESFCAALLFAFGLAYLFLPERIFMVGMGISAAAFLYCQARILRASKGIPAWRAPEVVPLVVATGLAEGAGIAFFFTNPEILIGFVVLVIARYWAWRRYRAAVRSPALEQPGRALLLGGTIAALVVAPFLPALAGGLAVAAGWWLKHALVTRAAHKQGFSLPHLPVRGTR